MQAQEYPYAKWSIGQRSAGIDDAAVQRLVDDGTILRTHALRPTWHFVAGVDLGWIQALTGPRVAVFNAHYNKLHGLDEAFAVRTNKVITGALRGGNQLTRAELAAALDKAGLPATGNRLAYVVMWAELQGLIANGAQRGKQHTYALVSERVSRPITLAPEEALAELTRRYFTSHGPATVKDYAWWSSLTQAQIRRGIGLVGDALVSTVVSGREYWYAPDEPPPRDKPPKALLLQGYDEYGIGYSESRSLLNLAGTSIAPENPNQTTHLVVLDSQVIGRWRRRVERTALAVSLVVPGKLTRPQRRAIEAAATDHARYAGLSGAVEWT
jgi:hypothetical protein